MFPASFTYLRARSVEEASELLSQYGEDAKLLAGGHSLIPAMKLRLTSPRYLIDLSAVPALRGARLEGRTLVIGALTVHADVGDSDTVRQHLPGLAEAASVIGDLQVRNRGTIGGSVAHADPAADFPVMLTALDAAFVLQSRRGRRTVKADGFFIDFYATALKADEVLTEIHVPLPPADTGTAYAKLGHPASGFVVVSAGVLVEREPTGQCRSARVVMGGLGSGPARAPATEAALRGQVLTQDVIAGAAAKAPEGVDVDGDVYASAEYKRHMATVYAARALELASKRG
jgi:carbon-monoxide dehydrogenase medium subunit